MLTKPLLAVLLAACAAASDAASNPNEPPEFQPPPGQPQEKDHYFCCQDVNEKEFSGGNCTEIPESQVGLCSTVLYCDGKYTKKNGNVTCE
jgi:hypothetical protein